MKTVLITNGQLRKSLCAARSLGRNGIRVIVSEETRCNPTAFSKYCDTFVKSPNAKKEPGNYLTWLKRTIQTYHCDVFFPMDDDTMDIAVKHYAELSTLCTLPVPNPASYEKARNKGSATRLAEQCGVPCPKTVIPDPADGTGRIAGACGYPLVIKPTDSSGSRGIRVAHNETEFDEAYREIRTQYEQPIFQEYIEQGDRYDVCLLVDREQQIKATFVQKELRHFPVEMGPSTIQQSAYFPELVTYAKKMLKQLPWFGIIEFEFMVDPRDGVPKFMEINPRFWCSLHTAVVSGVDFPLLLFKLAIGENFTPVETYRIGQIGSWLLPGDIFHFITNKNRRQMEPPFLAGKKHSVSDDILSRDDPAPTLGFLAACFRYVCSKETWTFMFKR